MYSDKAFTILNSSINSAVFIDEKAKDFYSEIALDPNIAEEKLSFELFDTFKKNGKNLAVHKFDKSNLEDPKIIEYLFKGKDLILLDWELAEHAGQEYSLNLLSKAISAPNINFCCIYSSSTNFNQIPLFLDAYFSGLSKENFESIKNEYSFLEINDLKEALNKDEIEIDKFLLENSIDFNIFPIENFRTKQKGFLLRLIHISLNIDQFFFPEDSAQEHEVLNTGDNSFMINNTFVLTLKKEFNEDSDITKLLKRISKVIVKNKGSFFQLLGLEMQSIFNSNERFIDETILKSSTEALFQFRNHINNDKTFGAIIKNLLLEQATLKLRTAKLELLKNDFLDFKSQELAGRKPSIEDLLQLNVFYNAVAVKSLNPEDVPNLNFGDIFIDIKRGDYFLCVTALCDCFEPNKIQGNFYFVKGKQFKNNELALKLGDTAFISFLPENITVYWGNVDSAKIDKIEKQKDGENLDAYRIRKLTNEIEAYKQFLYKPFYIKPQIFNVENNKLIDKKIRMWDISNRYSDDEIKQDLNEFNLEYITTLRQDYAQRIANHAFGHPTRVGIDFVKI